MQIAHINASTVPPAVGGYSQALEVTQARRLLFISGQVPETIAGEVPIEFESQARLVWAHVVAQLTAANMSLTNLVKVTTFLGSRQHAAANRTVRQWALGNHLPALTVIVCGIFDERWLLEIEAVAAE